MVPKKVIMSIYYIDWTVHLATLAIKCDEKLDPKEICKPKGIVTF